MFDTQSLYNEMTEEIKACTYTELQQYTSISLPDDCDVLCSFLDEDLLHIEIVVMLCLKCNKNKQN